MIRRDHWRLLHFGSVQPDPVPLERLRTTNVRTFPPSSAIRLPPSDVTSVMGLCSRIVRSWPLTRLRAAEEFQGFDEQTRLLGYP